jgi:hypothetical protein
VTSFVTATSAAADATINRVSLNCAPAITTDGSSLYIGVKTSTSGGNAYLVKLNTSNLTTASKVLLKDPASNNNARQPDDGTGSPMIAPNGDVFYGVLDNPFNSNGDRGWLLHFNGNLTSQSTPGAFGWDDTASIVPASMVPSYSGPSSYLIMSKYNNYAGSPGGNGVNKVAILDPGQTQVDPRFPSHPLIMKEIMVIAGITPDPDNIGPGSPNAVREWCINTAAVDPQTFSIIVNSEDGTVYQWDTRTNTFTHSVSLTAGIGEAYTPTLVGPDGTVYAISNATLFAIVPEPGTASLLLGGAALLLGRRGSRRKTN